MDNDALDITGHGIKAAYTLSLTKAFGNGEISADDYIHRRAALIGKPNFVHGLLLPVYQALRLKLRPGS